MFGSGKCYKKDCGCQKFWQKPESSDSNICGCEHHEAYHEQRPLGGNNLFSSSTTDSTVENNDQSIQYTPSNNLFLATSQVPQELDAIRSNNIRAFIRNEELKGRLSAVASASTLSPASNSGVKKLNFNLHKEHGKYRVSTKSKIKRNQIKPVSFEFTLIPKRTISTIPKKGNSLWEQLNSQNLLLQKISFDKNDEDHVNNQITSVFPCLTQTGWICYKTKTTSELQETPYEPNAIKDLDYIRRVSTSKSKVYIKPNTDDLCESSDGDSTEDDRDIDEIAESPNGSFQNIMKDFRRRLQARHTNNDNTRTHIIINENDVVKSLFDWARNANDKDLLRSPSIGLLLEDVTDTGGAFRQITSMFWENIYNSKAYFTDGIIDVSPESYILGKILFWTVIHCGLWPQWLHKMHIQYLIDEKIEVVNILKENNPIVYKMYRQLMSKPHDSDKRFQDWLKDREIKDNISSLSKKEAGNYVANYEVITIRQEALDDLKAGFNQFNIINELKNYGYQNLVRELYYRFTYDLVVEQFDSEYIEYQARSFYKPQYQLLYDKFRELLQSLNEMELKMVVKFITGAEIIPVFPKIKISWVRLTSDDASSWINRLPRASTCGNLLTLCENYDMSHEGFDAFKQDLYDGFKNCEGFSESAYSRSYDINFTLQDEISDSSLSSPMIVTPARLSTVQLTPNVDSASTIRSSPTQTFGNTVDNAIYVNDESTLNANLHQDINSNIQSSRYRWINVTNPLEHTRVRRRSNASNSERVENEKDK